MDILNAAGFMPASCIIIRDSTSTGLNIDAGAHEPVPLRKETDVAVFSEII